jgi:phosphoribosylaminoimidazole-succinocarboxamide synthase
MQGITSIQADSSGKVRENYDLRDGHLLTVFSDRISAFDEVLPDLIPDKGKILAGMSEFWLRDLLRDIVPNHRFSKDLTDLPGWFSDQLSMDELDWLKGRFMIVRKAEVFPVECIVRGYITGSGWESYEDTGTVCGIKLPSGLVESDQLPPPLFTPSTKAVQGQRDENISFAQMTDIIGKENAKRLREYSLALYRRAASHALKNGIIIADTKFEFGLVDGEITLIDEVLTPDSSRFWPADTYEPGHGQPSYDKQYVRDWLKANWKDRSTPPPRLPEDVIAKTVEKYTQAYEIITGAKFTS